MMRARVAGERGQGILEFAVIFPIFALLIFMVIDGGVLMGRYSGVNHAANEGARLAATGANAATVINQFSSSNGSLLKGARGCGSFSPTTPEICVQWAPGPNSEPRGQVGSYVKVTVKYHYKFFTPLASNIKVPGAVASGGVDVSSCAAMRLERPVVSPPNPTGRGAC